MEPRMLHRSLSEQPHEVTSAEGSYLFLRDGSRILDACGGAAVAIIGHGNEEIIAATIDQMRKVSYVHTAAYTTESAEQLAQCILDPLPDQGIAEESRLSKAFFVGSGSEANDAAMKCSRQYWFEKGETQRKYFIARKQAYHGNTIGAMSLSSVRGRKVPYDKILLSGVSFVSAADPFHRPPKFETEEAFADELVREMEQEILRLGHENVISIVGETFSGATLGAMRTPKGYWPSVRALCDKYGILLHLDEVMCGMGRTGTYYAFEQEGILPDIVTVGKGLGGGYAPIAGMLINQKIVNVLKNGSSSFNHGQTYQAHPTSCATALAVQHVVLRDHLVAKCAAQGEKLGKLLGEAMQGAKYVADIRGRGLFWAVEFLQDVQVGKPFPPALSFGTKVQQAAFNMGIAVYPGAATVDGISGDHVTLAPPYTVTDEQLSDIATVLRRAYDHVVAAVVNSANL